jgi:hypothetical protein
MVSVHQSGNSAPDREEFPEIAEELGEDPARFLDKPLAPPRIGETSPMALAHARIRGIDSRYTAAKWLEVEHRLERGPRESVVERLEQRHRHLEEQGERELPGRRADKLRERSEALPSESVAEWPDREGGDRSAAFVSGSPFSRERVTDGGDSA